MWGVTSLPQLSDLDDQALRAHYAPLRVPWFRLNFVATTDGAAQGPDGLSGSINNAADNRVFHALRDVADVIIVGAGHRAGRGLPAQPEADGGGVPVRRDPSVAAGAPRRRPADGHLRPGPSPRGDAVAPGRRQRADPAASTAPTSPALRRELVARGFQDLLCEGGPHLDPRPARERCRRRAVPHHGPAPDRRSAPPDRGRPADRCRAPAARAARGRRHPAGAGTRSRRSRPFGP